jgi:tetratricopeptide (TPR) repeat protein
MTVKDMCRKSTVEARALPQWSPRTLLSLDLNLILRGRFLIECFQPVQAFRLPFEGHLRGLVRPNGKHVELMGFSRALAQTIVAMLTLACLAFPANAKSKAMEPAKAAARQGDWITAMQMTQNVLRSEPGNADAFSLQGDYHWANGDSSRAAESYEKALKNDPKHPDAIIRLTQYYLAEKRGADAQRMVAEAEAKDPKRKIDQIRAARGMISADQGDFAGATKELVSLATKDAKNPLYPMLLARLYNSKGVKEQARQYYEQAWNLRPEDMDLADEYAQVLLDLNLNQDALAVLKVVQEKNANNKSVDYKIGRMYYASAWKDPKLWGEAAKNLQFAVDKRPDHFLSQFLLGKTLLEFSKAEKKNLYKNAENCLRLAKDLRPNRTDVQESLNQVLDVQGRLNLQLAVSDSVAERTKAYGDTALVYFHELRAAAPTFKGVNFNIAKVWVKLANPDSVVFYCKEELAINPGDPAVMSRLVGTYTKRKDFAGLSQTLKPLFDGLNWQEAGGDNDKTPQSEFIAKYGAALANAYMELGDPTQARSTLETMLSYRPIWKDGHALNAYIDLKRNNFAGAIPVLQRAVDAMPGEADLWLQLGDSYYFSNQKHKPTVLKAKDCYLRASQLGSREGGQKFQQLAAVK